MRKTICFDLDGTLTDSREGIVNCMVHALEKSAAAPPRREALMATIGAPLKESLAAFLSDPSDADAEEALRLYRERYTRTGIYENRVYNGARAMLTALATEARLLVATSKPTAYARRILDHFELTPFFAGVYGSELDGRRTRKDELLAHLLREESLKPADAVMVGDRRHDMEGAAANRLAALGVTWGFGSKNELAQAGARWIADTPERATALLRGWMNDGH